MSEQPQVVVRGEAVLTVPPEVAELGVTVRVSARDRQTAIERCGARSAEVTRIVTAAGDAVETADTAAVSVHVERYDQGPGTPVERAWQSPPTCAGRAPPRVGPSEGMGGARCSRTASDRR